MNKLLEIKDKAVKFCGEYEHFILPVVRFAVAFIAFITIDLNIGYMAKISSMLVALSTGYFQRCHFPVRWYKQWLL